MIVRSAPFNRILRHAGLYASVKAYPAHLFGRTFQRRSRPYHAHQALLAYLPLMHTKISFERPIPATELPDFPAFPRRCFHYPFGPPHAYVAVSLPTGGCPDLPAAGAEGEARMCDVMWRIRWQTGIGSRPRLPVLARILSSTTELPPERYGRQKDTLETLHPSDAPRNVANAAHACRTLRYPSKPPHHRQHTLSLLRWKKKFEKKIPAPTSSSPGRVLASGARGFPSLCLSTLMRFMCS